MDEATQLIPEARIFIFDNDPIIIGGSDSGSMINEVNFYSSLNSFAFNADLTIEDHNNEFLNMSSELNGAKVTICIYEIPEKLKPFQQVSTSGAIKVMQKTFTVDHIEVIKFGPHFQEVSTIKIHLTDTYESLILDKIICYSNFDLKWSSKQMNVIPTMHRILEKYEAEAGEMIIPEKLFGVPKTRLKRRFTTDRSSDIKSAFHKYIDSLYNTRWYEFLTNSQPVLDIPQCLLAYTNLYSVSDGELKRKPYLTSANMLDTKPGAGIYSLPYASTGKILDYAHKDYNINIEDTSVDLLGGINGEIKDRILAFSYRKHTYNPKRGFFEDDLKLLQDVTQLIPAIKQDIESTQSPKYLGWGPDPKFSQMDNYSKALLLEYPFNIKDNHYYFSNGSNSFYKDMCDLLLRPMVYVSIPFSGWHSPGQEIDLRMINANLNVYEVNKDYFFSMNKLISGRWKILNSVTTLKRVNSKVTSGGMTPIETVGLTRARYFRGTKSK